MGDHHAACQAAGVILRGAFFAREESLYLLMVPPTPQFAPNLSSAEALSEAEGDMRSRF